VVYTHDGLTAETTGTAGPVENWIDGHVRKRTLRGQTVTIADRLGTAGVQAYADSDVSRIDLVTGGVERLIAFRSMRNVLPTVAAKGRRPLLNALTYLLETDPQHGKYARYAVVTSGLPVEVGGDLRGRIEALQRLVSRFAYKARRDYDVEMLFRGTEYTRKVRASGEDATYHPHCNLIYTPMRRLSQDEWAAFLAMMHVHFGTVLKDCGRIENTREVVKYTFKPAELLEADPDELRWVYEQTTKLRLVSSFGDLAELMKRLKDGRLKLATLKGEIVECHKEHREPRDPNARSTGEVRQRWLGTTLPSPTATPWAEPSALIENYDAAPDTAVMDELGRRQRAARAAWDANGAPEPEQALAIAAGLLAGKVALIGERQQRAPFRVHTGSLTDALEAPAPTPLSGGDARRFPAVDAPRTPEAEDGVNRLRRGPGWQGAKRPKLGWKPVDASRSEVRSRRDGGRAGRWVGTGPPPAAA